MEALEFLKTKKSETQEDKDTEAIKAEALKDIAQMETYIEEIDKAKTELRKAIDEDDKESMKTLTIELPKLISVAKALRRKMEGKTSSEISAEYSYKDEKGKEVKETIEINFETELASLTDFYKKHDIEIPTDFTEKMQDIWERNTDNIKEAIEEKGFNKILLIPENFPNIKDLEEKMTAGYKKEKGNETYWGIKADSITETKNKTRIVLVHNAPDFTSQPELKKTLGKKYGGEKEDGKDNKAEDFINSGESLTLSEYLILQREIFEKTGVHLDSKKTPDGNYIYWTWLPGSKSGSRVVYASWSSGGGRLDVDARAAAYSNSSFGCRLSRSFS